MGEFEIFKSASAIVPSVISDDSIAVPSVVCNAPLETVRPAPVKSVIVSEFTASVGIYAVPSISRSPVTKKSPPAMSTFPGVFSPMATPPPVGLISRSPLEVSEFPDKFSVPEISLFVPDTSRLLLIEVVPVVFPIATVVALPPIFNVSTVWFSRLKVVADDVKFPPDISKSFATFRFSEMFVSTYMLKDCRETDVVSANTLFRMLSVLASNEVV